MRIICPKCGASLQYCDYCGELKEDTKQRIYFGVWQNVCDKCDNEINNFEEEENNK